MRLIIDTVPIARERLRSVLRTKEDLVIGGSSKRSAAITDSPWINDRRVFVVPQEEDLAEPFKQVVEDTNLISSDLIRRRDADFGLGLIDSHSNLKGITEESRPNKWVNYVVLHARPTKVGSSVVKKNARPDNQHVPTSVAHTPFWYQSFVAQNGYLFHVGKKTDKAQFDSKGRRNVYVLRSAAAACLSSIYDVQKVAITRTQAGSNNTFAKYSYKVAAVDDNSTVARPFFGIAIPDTDARSPKRTMNQWQTWVKNALCVFRMKDSSNGEKLANATAMFPHTGKSRNIDITYTRGSRAGSQGQAPRWGMRRYVHENSGDSARTTGYGLFRVVPTPSGNTTVGEAVNAAADVAVSPFLWDTAIKAFAITCMINHLQSGLFYNTGDMKRASDNRGSNSKSLRSSFIRTKSNSEPYCDSVAKALYHVVYGVSGSNSTILEGTKIKSHALGKVRHPYTASLNIFKHYFTHNGVANGTTGVLSYFSAATTPVLKNRPFGNSAPMHYMMPITNDGSFTIGGIDHDLLDVAADSSDHVYRQNHRPVCSRIKAGTEDWSAQARWYAQSFMSCRVPVGCDVPISLPSPDLPSLRSTGGLCSSLASARGTLGAQVVDLLGYCLGVGAASYVGNFEANKNDIEYDVSDWDDGGSFFSHFQTPAYIGAPNG